MAKALLVIGNKNYSSWSLRGWLSMRLSGLPFEERLIPLDRPETPGEIRAISPSGRVPCLLHEGLVVWDSLAIGEYLAEVRPEAHLWPQERAARARARSLAAEMHAGFAALRQELPMDLRARLSVRPSPAAKADIARIVALWEETRAAFGAGGSFLFGKPGVVDAFYAPVAGRFITYGVELPEVAAAYRDSLMSWELYREWLAAAAEEPWVIENFKL